MTLKSTINGRFECFSETDVLECRKILATYNIGHSIEGTVITIDTEIRVTPIFDRDGFERKILKSARRYSDPILLVGEPKEETEDEIATWLLRQ